MIRTAILFCLVSWACAVQMPCRNCNSKEVKLPSASSVPAPSGTCLSVTVTPCEKAPCDLKRGTNVTFEVQFTAGSAASKLTADVHGIINKIPIKFPLPNSDGCKDSGIQCPLVPGQTYNYKDTLAIQSIYPTVSVVVQWSLKDQNGTPVFCVVVPAKIAK